MKELLVLREQALSCTACNLHKSRTNVVFGVGNTNRPKICFIGEAPGEKEDDAAEPFVGRSGQLLINILKEIGFNKHETYITNTVLCRPPRNRQPFPEELAACEHFLVEQLRLVNPKVIVTLGTTASQHLFKVTTKISQLRGKWWKWNDTPVRATFHPSFLLRSPNMTKFFREDLSEVLLLLDSSNNL